MIEQTPYVVEVTGLGFRTWTRRERTEVLKKTLDCESDEALRSKLRSSSLITAKMADAAKAPSMWDPGLLQVYFPDEVEGCARVYAVFEVKGKIMTREFFITNFDDEAFRTLTEPERKEWERISVLRQIHMRFSVDPFYLGQIRLHGWVKIGQ